MGQASGYPDQRPMQRQIIFQNLSIKVAQRVFVSGDNQDPPEDRPQRFHRRAHQ